MKYFFNVVGLIILIILVSSTFADWNKSGVGAQALLEPELPRVFLNTTYVQPTGQIITVAADGDVQSAINVAQPGDQIIIESGATFVGNFTLPVKSGSQQIVIRSTNVLPEGRTATPADASTMAKIVSPNTDAALKTVGAASNYRIVGIEFAVANSVSLNFGIVKIGAGNETSIADLPSNIIIDRSLIHGNPTGDVSRGVALNSASTAIVNSSIYECHGVGFDTQAIAGWNGPGPFKIADNYLEGAGENFMLGGADPRIANLVPSDIEFVRNRVTKPTRWNPRSPDYAGIHWSVKNLFELKNARRVLVKGNLFENNWVDAQSGPSILFTPRNQDGTAPWSVVEDVTFEYNIIRNVAAGVSVTGTDDLNPSQSTRRIKVGSNLFDGVGGSLLGGNGRWIQLLGPTIDQITIRNNTTIQTAQIIVFDGGPHTSLAYIENITAPGEYGMFGSGSSEGNASLSAYAPGALVTNNVMTGRPSYIYPAGNFFPSTLADVGFTDLAARNYRLLDSSPYKGLGASGRDLGVDFDALESAMVPGDIPPPPPPPPPPPGDTSPPTVENLAAPVVGQNGVALTFRTNEAAIYRGELVRNGVVVNQISSSEFVFNQTAVATGLQQGQAYQCRVMAIDRAGNISPVYTITVTTRRNCR